MLDLGLGGRRLRRVLLLGAHCDDIEIGCGGTLLRILEGNPEVAVDWVVLTSDERRAAEAKASAEALLADVDRKTIRIGAFRDGYLPYDGSGPKEYIEGLKSLPSPDLILTHCRDDRHQDHRLVSDLTWNTFRDHAILEYEIPKWDGDFGLPNTFVCIDETIARRKVDHILRYFPSQAQRSWFAAETFQSVMRLRGLEARSPSGFAEGFYSRKLVLGRLSPR